MRILSVGMMIVLSGLTASCATMAPVRGQVVPPRNPGPGWTRDAIVYLESRDPEQSCSTEVPAKPLVLTNGRFDPAVVVCAAGTALRIRNEDRVYHIPFSRSPEASFEGKPIEPGHARNVAITGSGTVQIYCELHSQESAEVRVLRCGRSTWLTADGRFALGRVTPGPYTLHLWHPRLGEKTRTVDVARDSVVTVDLRY